MALLNECLMKVRQNPFKLLLLFFFYTSRGRALTRSVSEERHTTPRLHFGLVRRSDKCVTFGRVRYMQGC